ncbi:AcrR family transcriptional regulator [Caulobacter ginsengisoli]|uniref:AcrR family transcriptional regulator n=1 Tax=Caulobacter ginsengisoli TaxID=400775 RepID=A0ABU0IRD9_9CAUL|nr:TetR family transcriptional regulator [Caulobacter ginsengisoli]MDQ0463980.1 AcrR family transcriptional regulator [Caulobacter ginsengisoli]
MAADPLSPRKQPVQARSRALVEAILVAAARVLEQSGLEGFNTNRVAEAAGVSVGSLYQYFPGKTALLAALVRQDAAAFGEALTQAANQGATLRETAEALIDVMIAHQSERPALARALDFAERDLDLEHEDDTVMLALTQGALARHAAELPGVDFAEAAQDLMVIGRALSDSGIDPASLKRRLLRAVLGYLTGP